MKINKTNIDKLCYTGSDKFYWDDDVKGFGVKVTSKSKSFIVQGRVNGRTIRKKIGSCCILTPDKARTEAKILLGSIANNIDINEKSKADEYKKVTLKQAFDDMITTRKLTESTRYSYNRTMETVFADWKNTPIVAINKSMIITKFKNISNKSGSSANLYFRYLRAIINFAMEKYSTDTEPLILSNPCDTLRALRIWNPVRRRDRYIKPTQLKEFFTGLQISTTDRPQIQITKKQCLFILFTGCRDQEAARVKCKDIDFDEKTITFPITKNHHKHILPMGKWLYNFVKELCDGLKPDDYLFPANNRSGHIKDHRKAIKEISQACGITFSLHDLRRTFATIATVEDINQHYLKRMLNHVQSDVTEGYIKIIDKKMRLNMQKIEDFILKKVGIK